ncbi:MAG: hypothetical protein VYA30_16050 [Myxococcota bacterium]|nr:hypothetical protein [Myxococcota bacterium]
MATKPDVVFVNGYYTTPNCTHKLVEWMDQQGLACSVPELGGLMGQWQTARVKTSAARLAAHIEGLPKGQKPWLIGHSLGGVISRFAVHEYQLGDRVSGVITLGTPHRGVGAIGLVFLCGLGLVGPAAIDMLPGSRIMNTFAASKWPFQIPLISIASTADRLCPLDASQLDEDTNGRCIQVDGLGHNELIRHESVLTLVFDCMTTDGRAEMAS